MTDRRRVIVVLGEDVIRQVLDLPDDLQIISVQGDWERDAVRVMIAGDRLEPVAPYCEPPIMHGGWQYDAANQRLRFLPFDWDLIDQVPHD